MRLDQTLVALGLAPSRSKAQALIKAGAVEVDGAVAARPSQEPSASARILVREDPCPWASRAGLKLAHALQHFALSPEGAVALDCGASTGGFTDVLLAHGAARVYAVDVGHGQLAEKLRGDSRVVVHEGLNLKDLDATHVPEPVAWITADLSFISLEKALPAALARAAEAATLVALVKPQFEVGRDRVGKGGIVKDADAQANAVAGVEAFLVAAGWTSLGAAESPILGADGNREFLLAASRSP